MRRFRFWDGVNTVYSYGKFDFAYHYLALPNIQKEYFRLTFEDGGDDVVFQLRGWDLVNKDITIGLETFIFYHWYRRFYDPYRIYDWYYLNGYNEDSLCEYLGSRWGEIYL